LRGASLSVNGLVHIPGFGDYQMSRIELLSDPYLIKHPEHRKYSSDDDQMEVEENSSKISSFILHTIFPDPEKQVFISIIRKYVIYIITYTTKCNHTYI